MLRPRLWIQFLIMAFLSAMLFHQQTDLHAFPPSANSPNILVIMADDLGWSDLGCYGGEISTPAIDSLAAEGMRFTQFYNNAICGPTRASLLTGLYCQQVGHPGNNWNAPKDFSQCVTFSEVLQRHGYHTMMVGKWQGRDLAVQRGFDRFFGPMCQGKVSYFHEVQKNPFYLNDKRWSFPAEGHFMTDAFSEHAVQLIDEAAKLKKPFLLYAAYIAPHWPLHAREKDIAKYRDLYRKHGWEYYRKQRFKRQAQLGLVSKTQTLAPKPSGYPNWKANKHKEFQAERMAVYAAQVSSIDRGVGNILKKLKEHHLEQNTLVLFLSDNGAAPDGGYGPSQSGFGFSQQKPNNKWRIDGVPIRPGSHLQVMPGPHDTFSAYGLAWATTSNTPFRSTKMTAYEGGIRTPLIVRWPAVIKQHNQITQQTGHVIDLMATCLDVAHCDYPTDFDGRKPLPLEGRSLAPIFNGQTRTPHQQLCWSTNRNHAIRVGDWKLIKPLRRGNWELYDLKNDPGEAINLAKQNPSTVNQLSAQFREWQKRVHQK